MKIGDMKFGELIGVVGFLVMIGSPFIVLAVQAFIFLQSGEWQWLSLSSLDGPYVSEVNAKWIGWEKIWTWLVNDLWLGFWTIGFGWFVFWVATSDDQEKSK